MLLPLWLFHWIFLSWWISCPVSKYQKSTRKSWIFDLFPASNFWPVPTSEKLELENLFCRWILEIWTWNLRGLHLPRSCQKKPVYRPLEEKWRTKRLSCLLSHESRKKGHREVKRQKEAAIRLKGKGERMNAEAWRSVLAAQWRKSKSIQHLVFPGGLPSKY